MSGSDQEDLPDVQQLSRGPPGCSRLVGRLSRMSGCPYRMIGSGRKALPDVREWSAGPPKYPEVVGSPSRMSAGPPVVREWTADPPGCLAVVGGPPGCPESSRMCGKPSRLSESGQETLPNVQDATLDIWEWSGGYHGCSGVVGRHYRMSGMSSWMSGNGRDALLDYQKWSAGPL